MALSIEQSALMTLSAAWHFDKRKKYEMGIAMAKLSACRTALAVSDEAIQLLGGYGYMTEYEVERCYRDAKALALFEDNPMGVKDDVAAGFIGRIN
jgi:alkylation response protein AidB-like acyl-CoA dehydrogenase